VAVAVPAVLQVAPVYVAPLGSLLGTTALSAVQLATGVALAAVPALAIVAVRGMGSKNTAGR
jgi:hypothetical protein